MTSPEYILVPVIVILLAIIFVILEKKKGVVRVVDELNAHVKKQTSTIAKQISVVNLLKDNRCGLHKHTIDDRVMLLSQINGLSHKITEVFVKKNQETIYTCRRGDSAIRVPEHLVKLYEEPKKD